jgi:ABC-type nickel/cobalt efflux system permease component RcnA
MATNKLPMNRRLKTTLYVVISQALLIALAIAWLIHMGLIAANGSVSFIENNSLILWIEITTSALIAVFAVFILTTQIQRLGERRRTDRNRNKGKNQR